MKNILLGVLCSAFVFAVLSWATTKKTVRAAVLTAPPAGRFELVQLHPSAGSYWSGILDTETGCVWAYASQTVPASAATSFQHYQSAEGSNVFDSVNYDATEYTAVPVGKGYLKGRTLTSTDYSAAEDELFRVQALCDRARVQALEAAAH